MENITIQKLFEDGMLNEKGINYFIENGSLDIWSVTVPTLKGECFYRKGEAGIYVKDVETKNKVIELLKEFDEFEYSYFTDIDTGELYYPNLIQCGNNAFINQRTDYNGKFTPDIAKFEKFCLKRGIKIYFKSFSSRDYDDTEY